MKKIRIVIVVTFMSLASTHTNAQNKEISRRNIGWYQYFGTIQLTDKISIVPEYQWRREDFVSTWQQSLARISVNYKTKAGATLQGGYGFIQSFPFGDYPTITGIQNENRIHQSLIWGSVQGKFDLQNRIRLEQRWLMPYKPGDTKAVYYNRIRYMLKASYPINSKLKAIVWDELFTSFGKNVKGNVFDQNRLFVGLGYEWAKGQKVELGYFSHIVEQGNRVNNLPVFQFNNGFVLSVYNLFDVRKKVDERK